MLGCWVNGGVRSTDFVFNTRNPYALPISDLAAHDIGDTSETYGATIGAAMFRTDLGFGLLPGSLRKSPARSCTDIYFPGATSGYYWIDPNGGSTTDAVYAYCDMSRGGWTVIPAIRNVSFTNRFSGTGPTLGFAKLTT